jgi:hypothetical protein
MSAITDLIGGIVSGLGDTAVKIRTAITGKDPVLDAKLAELALTLEGQAQDAQSRINQAEAGNANLFVSGWRPFIGWICGAAIGYHFLVSPLLGFLLGLFKVSVVFPALDMGQLWTLVTGMLGLGTMRTVEKLKDAQGNH